MASKSYTVVAPLVIAKNELGADLYVYKGGVVPDGQSDEWIKQHEDSKMIASGKDADKALTEQLADVPAETPAKK